VQFCEKPPKTLENTKPWQPCWLFKQHKGEPTA